jgi:ABC-type sugar transport system ATPase subunit
MMNWIVPASNCPVWSVFSIEVTKDISFECRRHYQLTGDNGSGKSSFLKRILIPQLLTNPSQQYVLYIEQQIQSQFDAVKAYAALQKPPVQISSFEEMVDFQLQTLSEQLKVQDRPCFIILDECQFTQRIVQTLSRLKIKQYCLLYVSHRICDIAVNADIIGLKLDIVNERLSKL